MRDTQVPAEQRGYVWGSSKECHQVLFYCFNFFPLVQHCLPPLSIPPLSRFPGFRDVQSPQGSHGGSGSPAAPGQGTVPAVGCGCGRAPRVLGAGAQGPGIMAPSHSVCCWMAVGRLASPWTPC